MDLEAQSANQRTHALGGKAWLVKVVVLLDGVLETLKVVLFNEQTVHSLVYLRGNGKTRKR